MCSQCKSVLQPIDQPCPASCNSVNMTRSGAAAAHVTFRALGASAAAAASSPCCRRGLLQHALAPAVTDQSSADFAVPSAAVWGLAGAVFLVYLVFVSLCWHYCCRGGVALADGQGAAAPTNSGSSSGGSTGGERGKASCAPTPPIMGRMMVVVVEPDMTVQLGREEEPATRGGSGEAEAAQRSAREAGGPPAAACIPS